eukprot:2305032-Rhodomonas_salina.2
MGVGQKKSRSLNLAIVPPSWSLEVRAHSAVVCVVLEAEDPARARTVRHAHIARQYVRDPGLERCVGLLDHVGWG